MAMSRSLHRWLCLPSRVALILDWAPYLRPAPGRRTSQPDGIWWCADPRRWRKDLPLGGRRETELRLSAAPQRDRLLRLLEEYGPAGVKLDRDPRLIMSSGGGAGFY